MSGEKPSGPEGAWRMEKIRPGDKIITILRVADQQRIYVDHDDVDLDEAERVAVRLLETLNTPPFPPADPPAPTAMPTWINVALAWIKNHGRHTADCYQNRAFESECDCGLWDLKQLIRLREEAAPPPAEAPDSGCFTLPNGSCVALDCKLHGRAEAPASEPPIAWCATCQSHDCVCVKMVERLAESAPTRAEPTRDEDESERIAWIQQYVGKTTADWVDGLCQQAYELKADLHAAEERATELGEQAKRAEEERDEARAGRGTSDREWLQENDRAKRLERENAALVAERDRLREAFEKHATHLDCSSWNGLDMARSEEKCDCGYRAALAPAEDAGKE